MSFSILKDFFEKQEDVCVAFLFGSRARGAAQVADWDLAVYFNVSPASPVLPASRLDELARLERLRAELAGILTSGEDCIDLIDLKRAPLNLCITVAEEGQILKGSQSLELFRFYQRAWSLQEEFHFRKAHGL